MIPSEDERDEFLFTVDRDRTMVRSCAKDGSIEISTGPETEQVEVTCPCVPDRASPVRPSESSDRAASKTCSGMHAVCCARFQERAWPPHSADRFVRALIPRAMAPSNAAIRLVRSPVRDGR